ncbi:hypothetical protein XM38_026440 [Halomicronema hongdechloris C2206]|uniref:Uncharacterized protein n=1 Tax=Halomicronema hongdechloris C2206 TaxID=1641165 RepID=A0A1Z3HN23_9CYAN|nr:hypothetical protein XM38_026440 [Halomicronema hongdechloris C2206]
MIYLVLELLETQMIHVILLSKVLGKLYARTVSLPPIVLVPVAQENWRTKDLDTYFAEFFRPRNVRGFMPVIYLSI